MDVVKCPHCGKELPGEAKFCPYCMQRLDEPVAVQLPREKNKPNIKAILISAAALMLVLTFTLSIAFYSRDKGGAGLPENKITDEPESNTNEASTSDVTYNDDTSHDSGFVNGQNGNSVSAPDNSGGGASANGNTTVNTGSDSSVNGNTPVNTGSTAPAENNSREPDTNKTDSGTEKNTTRVSNTNNTEVTDSYNPCDNGHTWAPVTETVHHDEVGHYETVEHQRTVTKYKCPVCYKKFASLDLYYAHFDSVHTPSYNGDPIRALRNQYTTANEFETYSTNEWVVDRSAYDETVVTGYKCSVCGKTK